MYSSIHDTFKLDDLNCLHIINCEICQYIFDIYDLLTQGGGICSLANVLWNISLKTKVQIPSTQKVRLLTPTS